MYNKILTYILIYTTMFLALILNIMAFPDAFQFVKPNFLLLIVLFWIVKEPRYVGIGHAFVCGLLLDVLVGYTLGISAFSFSVMAYMLCKTFIRMTTYSVLQQCVTILLISGVGLIIGFWLEHAFGLAIIEYNMLLSVISDAVAWPFLCSVLGLIYKIKKTPRMVDY